MKSKFIKDEIRNRLSEKLAEFFFAFNKKEKRWERKINGGVQIFDLLFYVYPKQILIEPVFRLKLYLIEDIYHQATQKEEEYKDATVTLGNSLGQVMKYYDRGDIVGLGEEKLYTIENESDISSFIKSIGSEFIKYILPYFDAYSSIQAVDKLLNEHPRAISTHNSLYPMRACIALIAARLMNRPDYYELAKIYDEETRMATPAFRKDFEDLVTLLGKY